MGVAARFEALLANLTLTDDQMAKGTGRREAVVKVLNYAYRGTSSPTANSLYVGSWGKYTRIRPPRDVDVMYKMPDAVYNRFKNRSGNRQSQLLQEVKNVIASTYANTAVRGDGPVVIVPFTAYNVEIVPVFELESGKFWICMTDGGGYYKQADYTAEIAAIASSDKLSSGNTRHLVRMMKCWQSCCNVYIKSFHIELVVIDFLSQWAFRGNGKSFYDWMVRDFLSYLIGRVDGYVYAPGTLECMPLGSAWKSKAESAWLRAKKACEYELAGNEPAAGDEWQKIFGSNIPKYV